MQRRALAAVLLAAPLVVLTASGANAADPEPAGVDATGTGACSVTATSLNSAGATIGFLNSDDGIPAASDAALLVASDGTIAYTGTSETAITANTWTVTVGGIPVKSGASENADENRTTEGVADVTDYLPVTVTGTMLVEVDVSGAGGARCTASAWVELDGNDYTSVNGLAGIGLLIVGLIGMFFARPVVDMAAPGAVRGHGIRGAFFGAMAGLGLALLLVATSVLPFGTYWIPLAIVGGGLLLGIVAGKAFPAKAASA